MVLHLLPAVVYFMVWARMVWNIFQIFHDWKKRWFCKVLTQIYKCTPHFSDICFGKKIFQSFVSFPLFYCDPQFSVGLSHNILIRYEIVWKLFKGFWGVWIFLRGSKHVRKKTKQIPKVTATFETKDKGLPGQKIHINIFLFPKVFLTPHIVYLCFVLISF